MQHDRANWKLDVPSCKISCTISCISKFIKVSFFQPRNKCSALCNFRDIKHFCRTFIDQQTFFWVLVCTLAQILSYILKELCFTVCGTQLGITNHDWLFPLMLFQRHIDAYGFTLGDLHLNNQHISYFKTPRSIPILPETISGKQHCAFRICVHCSHRARELMRYLSDGSQANNTNMSINRQGHDGPIRLVMHAT